MARPFHLRALIAALIAAPLVVCSHPARAHDLATDQLVLMPDSAGGVLRGQLTFDPHRTRQPGASSPADVEARLLMLLGRDLTLEIDGRVCASRYVVRELWAPASATLGDIVNLSCPIGASANSIRVSVAPSIPAFVVTVQNVPKSGAHVSHSVLIRGGGSTPEYRLSEAGDGWSLGGAEQFRADVPVPPPPSVSKSPTAAPSTQSSAESALLVLGLGLGPASFVLAVVGLGSAALSACRRRRRSSWS